MQDKTAETVGSVGADEAVRTEVVGRVAAELQAAAVPCRIGRIARLQRRGRTGLPLQRPEIIHRPGVGIQLPDKPVKNLGQVLPIRRSTVPHGFTHPLGRYFRNHLQTIFRAGEGHVEDVDVVDELQLPLLAVIIREQGALAAAVQFHVINPVDESFQRRPLYRRTAPAGRALVQRDFLREREDDIRELQPLGLMDGHHTDGGAGLGRRNLGIGLPPVTQESGKIVSVGSCPVQEKIHERLDIRDFRIEGFRIGIPQVAKQRFRQVRERMVMLRNPDVHRPGQETGHGSVSFRIRRIDQRELGHEPPDGHRRFHEEGIVGYHRNPFGNEASGNLGAFLITPHAWISAAKPASPRSICSGAP